MSDDDGRQLIHVRLSKALIKRIDHVSVEWDKDRARTIEELVEVALGSIQEPEAPKLRAVRTANGSRE